MAREGFEVVGSDISLEMLTKAASIPGGKQRAINIRIPHDAYTLYWRTKTLYALRALSSLGQQ